MGTLEPSIWFGFWWGLQVRLWALIQSYALLITCVCHIINHLLNVKVGANPFYSKIRGHFIQGEGVHFERFRFSIGGLCCGVPLITQGNVTLIDRRKLGLSDWFGFCNGVHGLGGGDSSSRLICA